MKKNENYEARMDIHPIIKEMSSGLFSPPIPFCQQFISLSIKILVRIK